MGEARQLVADIRRLGRNLGRTDVDAVLARCPTFARLERLHDRWTERLNRLQGAERRERLIQRYGSLSFPEPPLPGSATIVPIRSVPELDAEGASMGHCVAGYAESVLDGASYIYKVLEPERATLEVVRAGRQLVLGQLKRRRNAAPSEATRDAVKVWFERGLQHPSAGA